MIRRQKRIGLFDEIQFVARQPQRLGKIDLKEIL